MEAAQLKADGKAQRVIVTGCLAQRYSQDLAGKDAVGLRCCSSCQQWMAQHVAYTVVECC